MPLFSVAPGWRLGTGITPYSSITPKLNGYCYFWPSTLYTHKTMSSPFIVNTVMKKRAGGGLEAATPQTCCTQLASCRGTVWLSCLLLFRGEDKAVSESRVPGKQRYPTPTHPHTCIRMLNHTHTHSPRGALSCLARSKPTVQPLKLSRQPGPLLSWCYACVTFTVWWHWDGIALPAKWMR